LTLTESEFATRRDKIDVMLKEAGWDIKSKFHAILEIDTIQSDFKARSYKTYSDTRSNRPYQIESIKRIFEGIGKGKRKILFVQATGSGKTRVVIPFTDVLLRTRRAKRVLFLADRL
jgi:type I site-specific restriction endonuclease